MSRTQELEGRLANYDQTRVAVDAELHSAFVSAQKEREHRLRLEKVETELCTSLAQAVTERGA
eukprot:1967190-Alexandrium_andersonii.AAC.1